MVPKSGHVTITKIENLQKVTRRDIVYVQYSQIPKMLFVSICYEK